LWGALNWYRAFHQLNPDEVSFKIKQPVLFMWGDRDESFGRAAAEKTANYVMGPFRFHHVKAGHSLMAELPELVSNEVTSHIQTWPSDSKQWKLALVKYQPEDISCDQSSSDCLHISITPNGKGVKIRNFCDELRQGTVRISCTGWAPEAFVEYRFNLGAKTDVVQEYNGFTFGRCYFGHRPLHSCATISDESARDQYSSVLSAVEKPRHRFER